MVKSWWSGGLQAADGTHTGTFVEQMHLPLCRSGWSGGRSGRRGPKRAPLHTEVTLPRHHEDPFDRILIAQSIAEGRRLVTKDESILAYRGLAGFDPLSG